MTPVNDQVPKAKGQGTPNAQRPSQLPTSNSQLQLPTSNFQLPTSNFQAERPDSRLSFADERCDDLHQLRGFLNDGIVHVGEYSSCAEDAET